MSPTLLRRDDRYAAETVSSEADRDRLQRCIANARVVSANGS
jgi:hypothetical protein